MAQAIPLLSCYSYGLEMAINKVKRILNDFSIKITSSTLALQLMLSPIPFLQHICQSGSPAQDSELTNGII